MKHEAYASCSSPQRITRITCLPALLLIAALLAGCSTYELRGKAVEGGTSAIFIVDADDPRLDQPGLGGAVLDLTLDPGRLNSTDAGGDVTGSMDGEFAIPVDEFGAGMLEYDARLNARLSGYRSVSKEFMLPGKNQRVLIVLAPGDDQAGPRGEDFLEETLRESERYMDEN